MHKTLQKNIALILKLSPRMQNRQKYKHFHSQGWLVIATDHADNILFYNTVDYHSEIRIFHLHGFKL